MLVMKAPTRAPMRCVQVEQHREMTIRPLSAPQQPNECSVKVALSLPLRRRQR